MTIDDRRKLLADVLRPFDVGHPLIRIGAFSDGGYLVPSDLQGIKACFSPGVSQQSSFELSAPSGLGASFEATRDRCAG